MHRPHLHGPRTLALIAAFKFVKSALLIVLAVALFHLRQPDATAHFAAWLGALPLATGHELVARAIHELLGLTPHTMALFCASRWFTRRSMRSKDSVCGRTPAGPNT